jgi:hypothetical protein
LDRSIAFPDKETPGCSGSRARRKHPLFALLDGDTSRAQAMSWLLIGATMIQVRMEPTMLGTGDARDQLLLGTLKR